MRLIDADRYIEKQDECGWLEPITVTRFNEITPTVEAIPKADYENRLATDMANIKQLSNSVKTLQKANSEIAGAYGKLEADYEKRLKVDMTAMLTELLLEIEQCGVEDSHWIIKEKINALKGEEDGNE